VAAAAPRAWHLDGREEAEVVQQPPRPPLGQVDHRTVATVGYRVGQPGALLLVVPMQ
jgi:hypothetical protein